MHKDLKTSLDESRKNEEKYIYQYPDNEEIEKKQSEDKEKEKDDFKEEEKKVTKDLKKKIQKVELE